MAELASSSRRIRLECLGDLVLHVDGYKMGAARRKPLALLAYLAAEAPRAVNREALGALLWPDSAPDNARHTLTQSLYALRRECGVAVVVGTTQLTLAPEVSCDLWDFHTAISAGDCYASAVAYRGPFLDGVFYPGTVEFDLWVDRVRSRLSHQHRQVLIDCADRSHAERDVSAATAWLREAHHVYPDDSTIAERLALNYLVADAAHLAIDVINTFERRLNIEFELPLPDGLGSLRRRLSAGLPVELAPDGTPDGSGQESGSPALSVHATPTSALQEHPASAHPASTSTTSAVSLESGRRWMLGAVAGAACVALGYLARGTSMAALDRETVPATLAELGTRTRQEVLAAQLALVDSASIGRIVVLPSRTLYGAKSLDSLLPRLNRSIHRALGTDTDTAFARILRQGGHRFSLAQLVPQDETDRLISEIEGRRLPTTTAAQVAEVLRRSQAAIAIQPLIGRIGTDSIRVSFHFHRDFAHTSAARPGQHNIEVVSNSRVIGVDSRWFAAAGQATSQLVTFVLSMESCDPQWHERENTSPWCWTTGRRLRVALTPSALRQRMQNESKTNGKEGQPVEPRSNRLPAGIVPVGRAFE